MLIYALPYFTMLDALCKEFLTWFVVISAKTVCRETPFVHIFKKPITMSSVPFFRCCRKSFWNVWRL